MTMIDRSHRRSLMTATARRRASREDHLSTPPVRPQLLADGIIAGYIHDISARHRRGASGQVRYELAVDREAA